MMAEIRPFRGVRYNPATVGDLQWVIAPPYDVISPEQLKSLQSRSQHNIIHIDLPKEASYKDDPYIYAGQRFRNWLAEGVFMTENKPSIYVYQQRYTVPGTSQTKEFLGFLCAFRVSAWDEKEILPHEHTFAKPKEDRLNLMRTSCANFSPVYSFYYDPAMTAEKALSFFISHKKPEIDVKDDFGEEHRVWVVNEPQVVEVVVRALQDQQLYIADGHHRYETALDYKKEREAASGVDSKAGWNYVMMMLVNSESGGLTVLPTHRMVTLNKKIDRNSLKEELAVNFDLTVYEVTDSSDTARKVTERMTHPSGIGMVWKDEAWVLTPRNMSEIVRKVPGPGSDALKQLGVSLLHQIILPIGLGLDIKQQSQGDSITYTREAKEAVQKVKDGVCDLACLLNGPTPNSIIDVAQAGDAMPHKSTYFYPKLLSGLVLNDLNLKIE
jgi:uncharacterized protein (DUF1015 family)